MPYTPPTPYDGTMIFKPVTPLATLLKQVEAKRQDKTDKLAKLYAGDDTYKRLYAEGLKRLGEPDLISLDDAAAKLNITPAAYIAKAEAGEVLLIQMEGLQVVPACMFGKDGKVDQLKVDIAREFVLEGHDYFKFVDYLKFMRDEKADIAATVPAQTLRQIFKAAGVDGYESSITVKASMNQLIDGMDAQPAFRATLLRHLDAALISGGWDPSGGISRDFRNKYNLPGLTIAEDRTGVKLEDVQPKKAKTPKAPKSPKP